MLQNVRGSYIRAIEYACRSIQNLLHTTYIQKLEQQKIRKFSFYSQTRSQFPSNQQLSDAIYGTISPIHTYAPTYRKTCMERVEEIQKETENESESESSVGNTYRGRMKCCTFDINTFNLNLVRPLYKLLLYTLHDF